MDSFILGAFSSTFFINMRSDVTVCNPSLKNDQGMIVNYYELRGVCDDSIPVASRLIANIIPHEEYGKYFQNYFFSLSFLPLTENGTVHHKELWLAITWITVSCILCYAVENC